MSTVSQNPNRVPGETEARALRALLRRDRSLQLQLELQQLQLQEEVARADRSASSLRECATRAGHVQEVYGEILEVANKLIAAIELAAEAHDQAVDIMEMLSSAARARNAFSTMVDSLKTVLVNLEPPIAAIQSHTHLVDDEREAFKLIQVSANLSLSSVDVSLDAVTTSITEKNALLHPIRRVPPEVLERIFIDLVEQERDRLRRDFSGNFKPMERTMHFAPFILSAVCRRWRCISIDLPQLWTYLRIPTVQTLWSSRRCGVKSRNLGVKLLGRKLFEKSLERSNGASVEATLYPSDEMRTSTLFIQNIPPSTRLELLNVLRLPSIPSLGRAPLHLRIVQPNTPQPGATIQPTSLEISTKGIDKLSCCNTFPQTLPSFLTSQIKELHFQFDRSYHSFNILEVLHSHPKLMSLSFAGEAPELSSLTPATLSIHPPFVHFRLSCLELSEQFVDVLACIVKGGLSFPGLNRLVVHGAELFNPSHYKEIASVLSIVHTVTISTKDTSFPAVQAARAVFDLMYNLHSLRLSGPGVVLMVEALSVDPPKSVTNLLIENWDGNGQNVQEYMNALKDQNHSKATFTRVYFADCPNVPAVIRDEIEREGTSNMIRVFEAR